jgi:hypothetical protein
MGNTASALLTVGGVELASSRRLMDLDDVQRARVQYRTNTSTISVRIEFSLDGGTTWATLVAEDAPNVKGTNPYVSAWQAIPIEAMTVDVLLRAFGMGAGLLVAVDYVELQYA